MPTATSLTYTVSIQATLQILLAKQCIKQSSCTLGNGEGMACTNYLTETNKKHYSRSNARSDHAVLDFFVSFCIKAKRKINLLLLASSLKNNYHLNSTQTSY